jgi:hydrogenase small subunit
MLISRRQFLKYCTIAAGALGLSATDLIKIDKALALENGLKVIWINGATCSGCSTSLLNSVYYATIQEVLLSGPENGTLSLEYHPTVMAADGTLATDQANAASTSTFILAVEGSVQAGTPYSSTGQGTSGDFCQVGQIGSSDTCAGVVDNLARSSNCLAVLSIGTCASFGGIPGAEGGITGALGVLDFFSSNGYAMPAYSTSPGTSGDKFYSDAYYTVRPKTINIPGCPPNPNWIVGTIAYVFAHLDLSNLAATLPPVDSLRRPRMYYGERICNSCNRFTGTAGVLTTYVGLAGNFIDNEEPNQIGDPNLRSYCLKYIGCKGSRTKSDCSLRKWHSPGYGITGINWCVGAGAPCQGCTGNYFPDGMSPFHYIR